MKRLVIVTNNETIVEHHFNNEAALARLEFIRSKQTVITHELKDVVKHVEVKSQPEITKKQYCKVA